jgi:hypothetical protein
MEVHLFCSPSAIQYNPQTGEQLLTVSPYRCARRVGFDGFTFNSTKVRCAFPPAALLQALVPRAVTLGLKILLMTPMWPCATWWPLIRDLPRISCGKVIECIVRGESGFCHPFGPSFDVAREASTEMQAVALNLLDGKWLMRAVVALRRKLLKNSLHPNTVRKYESQVGQYLKFMGPTPLLDLWSDDSAAFWIMHCMEVLGLAKNTLKGRMPAFAYGVFKYTERRCDTGKENRYSVLTMVSRAIERMADDVQRKLAVGKAGLTKCLIH